VSSAAWQVSLFGRGEPALDRAFSTLRRHQLDERAWIDHAPGWLSGAETVFDALAALGDWAQHDRLMYGNLVEQPRLNASWRGPDGKALLPVLDEAERLLSARYRVDFTSGHGGMNFYRDGRDSVAWHRDKIPPAVPDPHVVIISVGEPRTFRLRPRGGGQGRSRSFRLGHGDLLVTGGTFQRTWEHAVPKVASAGPRISITMRHA
jgi:alkylated DNA repair dioxygenase AlkB